LPPPEEPLRQDESQRDQASQRSSKRRTPARRSSSPIKPWASPRRRFPIRGAMLEGATEAYFGLGGGVFQSTSGMCAHSNS
jgi:hypothetical protein